ncbi:flippase [Paenibacillus planticolens]|uniref:Oligosaccharide flippase family protein n=1 Tax=Paenibacillus planticolens TaxID=2654976 RepID=A0ABX1ZKI7_9BACL|nr:flippase [Paenibacillus planticolens]NOV00008.1 oligosaccharide flippase family protein [Paenibacillus planticolens]
MRGKIIQLMNKALKMGFFHLLSANLLLQIAGFGGQILLTRIVPVDDIGRIRVVQSFFGIITILASAGVSTTILKLCSEKITEKTKNEILNQGILICTITSVLSIIVVFVIARLGGFSNDNAINSIMQLYMLLIPLFAFTNLFVAYLQSQKKIHKMSKVQSYSRVLIILLSTFTAFLFGIYGYVIGLVVSNVLTFIVLIMVIKRDMKFVFFTKSGSETTKKMLKFSGLALATSISWQALQSIGIIMANYMNVDSHEIAYYGIGTLIITTMMIIPSTITQIMVPYISEKHDDRLEINRLLKKYEQRVIIVMFVVVILSYLILPILIPFAFGVNYINSIPYFKVLLIGLLFWSMYSPKHNTLMSIGRIDLNLYANIISVVINVVLNFILIRYLGMLGIALASSITLIIAYFVNISFYRMVFSTKG